MGQSHDIPRRSAIPIISFDRNSGILGAGGVGGVMGGGRGMNTGFLIISAISSYPGGCANLRAIARLSACWRRYASSLFFAARRSLRTRFLFSRCSGVIFSRRSRRRVAASILMVAAGRKNVSFFLSPFQKPHSEYSEIQRNTANRCGVPVAFSECRKKK